MFQPPGAEFKTENPLRGLLIAVPIAVAMWTGIYEVIRFLG